MKAPSLTVIVPVFNEEKRLAASARQLSAWLSRHAGSHELVFVDDGSTDSTPRMLAGLAGKIRHLRVLTLPRNRGKGAAVREGLRTARGHAVLFMDVDLSTAPSQIPLALRQLRAGCDIAIGSRAMKGSRLPVPQPLLRRLSGRIFNSAVRVLLGLPYADTQCGFKAMTRKTARLMARALRLDGFDFDVELLLLARRFRLRVSEFPITWNDRAHSTVRLMAHSLRMFSTLFSLRKKFHREVAFHPVMALPLILASVACAIVGQILMKHGARSLTETAMGVGFLQAIITNRFVWGGLCCYGLSAVTWLMALAKVDLSFAFPMLSLGFVATAVYSWAYFGEVLSRNRILGIALVILGVLFIAVSGKAPSQAGETRR
jgi:glycosyltransferase involved in cell wall biosynthesis/multidrug transporter EmrE-like cation transporter